MEIVTLTNKQKKLVLQLFNEDGITDIVEIAQRVFIDTSLDGRSLKTKTIKKYLAEQGIEDKSPAKYNRPEYALTEEQKEFITKNTFLMSVKQIIEALFPGRKFGPFNMEYVAVQAFAKTVNYEGVSAQETTTDEYKPPTTQLKVVSLINKSTDAQLREDGLNSQQVAGVKSLMRNLRTPRFIKAISAYSNKFDRDFFEAEYIGFTWDKPDLTAEEVNLYIILCQENIGKQRDVKLLARLEDQLEGLTEEEGGRISMTLTQSIDSYKTSIDKKVDRIRKLTDDLIGKRKDRSESRSKNNRSIAHIVERVMNEADRENLARMAKIKKDGLSEEVQRFSEMDELTAKIFGLNKDDILR
jgi:hypothetical protein